MPEIVHDIEALDQMVTDLKNVYRRVLAQPRTAFEFEADQAGSPDAANAIADFYDGWSDGRERIMNAMYDLIQALNSTIAAYRAQEADLTSAFGAEHGGS